MRLKSEGAINDKTQVFIRHNHLYYINLQCDHRGDNL